MAKINVVVVGAGVSGLTTALLLSRQQKYNVTVIAKFMPGDMDIEYTSPFAGANYLPMSAEGTDHALYEKNTWPVLSEIAENHPDAGIHFQDTLIYTRPKDIETGFLGTDTNDKLPWWKDVVKNFRVFQNTDLIPGETLTTMAFTSVCINVAVYLPWLVSNCRKNGVHFQRATLAHISEAADYHNSGNKADVVVNCTGLQSRKLGGVEDLDLVPARGQTVVVQNDPGPMTGMSSTDDGSDELTYTMTRAAGGGTVLGGCYQIGNWESQPDPNLAIRIMQRAIKVAPGLTNGRGIEALRVIQHRVGLRPLRMKGVRIEAEKIQGISVVHNYGHAGWGYQGSYGASTKAVELVDEVVQGMLKANL